MRLLTFFLSALFAASAFAGDEASPYRKLVAPDAVQEDFLGRVKSVKTTVSDVDSSGIAAVVCEETATFDEQGYLLEETSRNLKDKTTALTKRTYDSTGTLIKIEITTDGVTVTKNIRFIPEKRRLITEIVTPDGKSLLESEMTFDQYRKEGTGRDFDKTGAVTQNYQTTREAQGKEAQVTFSNGLGKITYRTTITWDSRGFETREKVESMKDHPFTAESEYTYSKVDPAGNWLELDKLTTDFEKGRRLGKDRELTTRTIEYY